MKTHKIIHKNFDTKVYSYEAALCNWSGLLVSLSLIGFFLFMKAVGLYEILEFRYFNFIFLVTGILTTLYSYREKVSKEGISYLTGIKMGLRVTIAAVIPFAIFIGIYLLVDRNFMFYINEHAEFGQYLSPFVVAAVTAMQGFASGAVVTFVAMQYFKRND